MSNFADLWEAHTRDDPDGVALVEAEREVTRAGLDRTAAALSAHLVRAGLGRQATVACLLHNSVEYVATVFAALKAAMIPINVNYRYTPREAGYLLDNADAEAVVFHTSLTGLVAAIRPALPRVRAWIAVDDGPPVPDWASALTAVVADEPPIELPWRRSAEDLLIIYTGGTTGLPKGVMWAQGELIAGLGLVTEVGESLESTPPAGPSPFAGRLLPASPLMHAAGLFSALATLSQRGCLVIVPAGRPRAEDFLDAAARHRVGAVQLVGDAFARPLVDALTAEPDRWELSQLSTIFSSGVVWSEAAKRRLLAHLPQASLVDLLGSTEAIGIGRSESSRGDVATSGLFQAADRARLIDDAGRARRPAPGLRGRLAIAGHLPVGYHKDPAKSASTFPTIDGVRYAVSGDFAEVTADGRLRLLGRGSGCINSGGEKIFPEEVEEILKLHPAVRDAACLGVPDERLGEIVCAVVEVVPGAAVPGLAEVRAHTGAYLARFKAPRRLVVVEHIDRSAAGKLDYPALRRRALAAHRS